MMLVARSAGGREFFLAVNLLVALGWVAVQGGNALAQSFKPLPPAGIEIDASVARQLSQRINAIEAACKTMPPDSAAEVEVLSRSVALAIEQKLFTKKSDITEASSLLDEAERRVDTSRNGRRGLALLGWDANVTDRPQLLIGGFRSRIDDSIQPYGLVVPAGYMPTRSPVRLDVWLHGRGDAKTELQFLAERRSKVGEYAPSGALVLHPFGRHCNAFKFAGETDVYEAIEHAGKLIPIDRSRIAMRGFSMGGAGVWHLGVHDPANWFAINPGAGFVDTLVYQGWTKDSPFPLDSVQRRLLNWYDVLPVASNLRNTHLIAYSGELDKQREAAERVIAVLKSQNVPYQHVIGAKMGHKIDEPSKAIIAAQLEDWSAESSDQPRSEIDFTTYLLRYANADWLRVEGLEEQLAAGRVLGSLRDSGRPRIELTTERITDLSIDLRRCQIASGATVEVEIDGTTVLVERGDSDRAFFSRIGAPGETTHRWRLSADRAKVVRKRPGLQGPIDDAFCEKFVFVLPSRPARHGAVNRFLASEQAYAMDRWRRLMRGDVVSVMDTEVTDEMIATANLVCFGDYDSNRYLARIASKLPIVWTDKRVSVGDRTFDATQHVPAFCYPNPESPEHYVVVNSGMTFREFSNTSNSRQIAMLPDWAVFDTTGDGAGIFAADVTAKGFFDEHWQLPERSTSQ